MVPRNADAPYHDGFNESLGVLSPGDVELLLRPLVISVWQDRWHFVGSVVVRGKECIGRSIHALYFLFGTWLPFMFDFATAVFLRTEYGSKCPVEVFRGHTSVGAGIIVIGVPSTSGVLATRGLGAVSTTVAIGFGGFFELPTTGRIHGVGHGRTRVW